MKDMRLEEVVLPVRLMKRDGDRGSVSDECMQGESIRTFRRETL